MSTAINSTHQQDRAAQQKLVNAHQHASAQGQQQGVAFSQMLSLACDEDTDLDALQLGGQLFGLKAGDKGEATETSTPAKRKTGKGLAVGHDDDATDGLHPAAQANATLLALLAQAQGAQTEASAASTAPAAPATETPTALPVDTQNLATATDAAADMLTAAPAAGTALVPGTAAAPETATADTAEKAVPGKAVRELARQLGAAMNNAQDNTAPTHNNGVAWGRQPAADSTAVAAQVVSGLEAAAPSAASGHERQALAAHSRPAFATDEAPATSDEPEAVTEGLAPAELRTSGSEGQTPTGLGGESLGGTELAERAPAAEEAGSAAEQWREQWAEAMDQMGQQVSYWVSQGGVRQATLRVGNGWQQAMDVKLSMKNGQAHIEFQTDHEAARSAIAGGGAEVLRELLAQSGIDLGQVSIGAQTSGGGSDPQAQGQAGRPGQRMAQASEVPAASELRPRNTGSTGLDVYV